MNANELTPIFALSYFFNTLITPPTHDTTRELQFIHNSVRIKIIPILCPSSFDLYRKQYTSIKGVNINRNFDYDGSWDKVESKEGKWSYKGEKPQSEIESQILESWIKSNLDANIYIDCHSAVGSESQETFYTFASDYTTKCKILEAQSLIFKYYEGKGYKPSKEMVRVISNGKEYPKIPYFFHTYNMPSIMIEQHPGDLTHGGTQLHNDKGDIENYVLMMVLYSYYSLENPNYFYLILDYKKYLYLLVVFAAICIILLKGLLLRNKR